MTEIDPPATMRHDAAVAQQVLRRLLAGPPSLDYADYPREVAKSEIAIDEAAARLANALNLYLD